MVYAILLQRKDLVYQHRQVDLQVKEMRDGVEAQRELVDMQALTALLQAQLELVRQAGTRQSEVEFSFILEHMPGRIHETAQYKMLQYMAALTGKCGPKLLSAQLGARCSPRNSPDHGGQS